MALPTADQFVEKHARNLKGALEDMAAGVSNVTEAPGKRAAEKQDKMKQNINKAIDDGTWARRVAAVSKEDWQIQMLEKGIPRVAGGVDAAKEKVKDFAEQFLPHLAKGQEKVLSMPDLSLEDNIARSAAMIRHNAKFKKK